MFINDKRNENAKEKSERNTNSSKQSCARRQGEHKGALPGEEGHIETAEVEAYLSL